MAPKIWDVLSESKRIIYTQPRHYLTLYLIFLIFQLILKHLQEQQPPTSPTNIISLSLLFFLFSSFFSNGASIAITYSANHAFFNRPVKLKEAIKSISTSFFPLLATDIVTFVISFFLFFLYVLLIVVLSFLIIYLGDINLTAHPYFTELFTMFFMLGLLPPVVYLLVILSLVKVIVVVESVWGLEPLRRSWKLVKGTKRLILSMLFLFESLQWMLVWISGYSWVLIIVIFPILTMIWLYSIVVITVLYTTASRNMASLKMKNLGRERMKLVCP